MGQSSDGAKRAWQTRVRKRGLERLRADNKRAAQRSRGGGFNDPEIARKAAAKSWESRRKKTLDKKPV